MQENSGFYLINRMENNPNIVEITRNIDLHIANKLKEVRTTKKITQSELAKKIGITFQQLQKYDWGKTLL